jgi:carbamoyl-phosphate synthase large subunit
VTYKKVIILGSGGLKIGQAGEFDYSGSQAIKALKEEGIKTILINPNIATVQTDARLADEVYFQPLNISSVTKILEKEKPDALFLSFGGQTALNLGVKLFEKGTLDKFGIDVLGTSIDSIKNSEDRDLFKENLRSIGIKTPKSFAATNVQEALNAADKIGYPIMMRSGFSLGGLGSGRITSRELLEKKAKEVFNTVDQILIEEYLTGWKEVEYEVIRDGKDQALTICNMENLDPMGIHTGESIVVAPSQTLNNREYQMLRSISIKIARHFKVIGECNVQFALDPKSSDYRVIEMNPRLSRSSALASKATGYPLAFVAAKLALGYSLDEIENSITKKTKAFFEPSLDYIVVKIPRWDTHKLKQADRVIGTEMKSVGEVMGVGRSFTEALQKAIRMLNIGSMGIEDCPQDLSDLEEELATPTDKRIFALFHFFQKNGSLERAFELTQITPWFLYHIKSLSDVYHEILSQPLTKQLIKKAKQFGFSDKTLSRSFPQTEEEIREFRINCGIVPYIKQIDTLAGEFEAKTNYLYLTYHASESDIFSDSSPKAIVLGSGPYCIGSSVEFDWCAVNTAKTLRDNNTQVVVINSNPETVSTDFDESDRLYFEELTLERVQDIADFENPMGIIVSVGGQIANNLALPLEKRGYNLLGTKGKDIDRAEDREKFSSLLQDLHIDQPLWESATSYEATMNFAMKYDYPVLIRPSYVLSGAAMNVIYSKEELEKLLQHATVISNEHPVVVSKFIPNAKELEIDGVADKGKVVIEAISEHIENAGVHSGDATIVLPPQRLYLETIRKAKKITRKIIAALHITGPFNIQFIAKENELKVIECNVRASRSFPFVSKVTGHNFIEITTLVLLKKYKPQAYETLELDYVGVKAPQFSYNRLKGSNPVAHVEMASTGEVACIGERLSDAFFRSWLSTDQWLKGKRILVSISSHHKVKILESLRALEEKGWEIYATEGTHDFLSKNGVGSIFVYKVSQKHEPNAATLIEQKEIDLIINIPKKTSLRVKTDGFNIRRLAIDHHIPLITNVQLSALLLNCLKEMDATSLEVKSWSEFISF